MDHILYCSALLIFSLFACQTTPDPNVANAPTLRMLPVATISSGEPNLFKASDGTIYLSWIEYLHDTTDALQFARLENESWSTPQTIATGTDWFVNWADFPSLVVSSKNPEILAAHWLQKRAAGTYDYDVHISQSLDGGNTWSSSFIPHRDSIAAEHGFVSLLPLPDGQFFATWLDGRNTKSPEGEKAHDDHDHDHHGAMTLRAATFDPSGKLNNEAELDDRICDCCQTSAALTDKGVVVVYRDRSEDEVRDISIVRQVDGSWTPAQRVHNDNWQITGCPVNGPAVVANGNQVVVAWFTMEGDTGMVKIAFSNDYGANFETPVVLSKNAIGRVDILYTKDGKVAVSWLDHQEDHAMLKLAEVDTLSVILAVREIIELPSERDTGFPRIAFVDDDILIAWTAIADNTKVNTAVLKWKD